MCEFAEMEEAKEASMAAAGESGEEKYGEVGGARTQTYGPC